MKYIEIADGISVLRSSIEAIEHKSEFVSLIHTPSGTFKSRFPYITMLEALEKLSIQHDNIMEKAANLSIKTSQFFSG